MNTDIKSTIGLNKNNLILSERMVKMKETTDNERGKYYTVKPPCKNTSDLYQLLVVNDDPDVHLVTEKVTKNKENRSQMASTSLRNLVSHLTAVSYSNCRPIDEKWPCPQNISQGSCKLLGIKLRVTSAHFKPIFPAYILNEDCSSQYYFVSNSGKDSQNNIWARVITESLVNRNKDSIWSNINSTGRYVNAYALNMHAEVQHLVIIFTAIILTT